MDKTFIKQAPVLLCQWLSPFTDPDVLSASLHKAIAQQDLLEKVIECANRHHVVPTLYAQLQRQNLLSVLPNDLQDYMQAMHDFQQARNQRLKEQACSIISTLNQADIIPLLMKGGDTLFYDVYPSIGARFMSDLDILLPEGKVPDARELLFKQGYSVPSKYQHLKEDVDAHHAMPIYKEGDDCAIELHYKPLNRKSGGLLSVNEAFECSTSLEFSSGNKVKLQARSLSPEHKVLHSFVHSEISHGYQAIDHLDIRQMDNFVRLVKYYEDEIDWATIQQILMPHGFENDLGVYCAKAQNLFLLPCPKALPYIKQFSIEKRYQNGLKSAMQSYYPLYHAKLGIHHLTGVFCKERLRGQFEVNTAMQYVTAIVKRMMQLVVSPGFLMTRLRQLLIPSKY